MKKIVLPNEYNYIAAFLTMRCNLNCRFCLNAFNKNFDRLGFDESSGEEWVNGLNKIDSRENVPVTLCGGEPFLHRDFIYIINNLKPELNIDLLTNLQWGEKGIERFVKEINPQRLKRNSPYASIRVSYHPEEMGNGEKLVKNAELLHNAGFSIGIWSILYPSQQQLSGINQMQFRCRDAGIDFRLKEFTGKFKGKLYGDYSKYPNSSFQGYTRACECKTSELLISSDMKAYRCHRDLFAKNGNIGSLKDEEFNISKEFRKCNNYGQCHPCDVKVKTNYKQELGNTSVEIKI